MGLDDPPRASRPPLAHGSLGLRASLRSDRTVAVRIEALPASRRCRSAKRGLPPVGLAGRASLRSRPSDRKRVLLESALLKRSITDWFPRPRESPRDQTPRHASTVRKLAHSRSLPLVWTDRRSISPSPRRPYPPSVSTRCLPLGTQGRGEPSPHEPNLPSPAPSRCHRIRRRHRCRGPTSRPRG